MEGPRNTPLHPYVPREIRKHAAEHKEAHVGPNVLRKLIEDFANRLEQFPDAYEDQPGTPERRAELVRAIGLAAIGYMRQRIGHERVAQEYMRSEGLSADPVALKELYRKADEARRLAHIALCDAVEIAARNVFRPTVEFRSPSAELADLLRMERKSPDGQFTDAYRSHVGELAVDYVFSLLRERGLGAAAPKEQ